MSSIHEGHGVPRGVEGGPGPEHQFRQQSRHPARQLLRHGSAAQRDFTETTPGVLSARRASRNRISRRNRGAQRVVVGEHTESVSHVPTLVPVLGKELSHVQFRSLENSLSLNGGPFRPTGASRRGAARRNERTGVNSHAYHRENAGQRGAEHEIPRLSV